MKNKKLIKIITPITSLSALTTGIALSSCVTKTNDDQTKKIPHINFEAGPKDLDLNSEWTPMTISNDNTDQVACQITIPTSTNVELSWRQEIIDPTSGQPGWSDWNTLTSSMNINLDANKKIQFKAESTVDADKGKVFSTGTDEGKYFNIKFDGKDDGKGRITPCNANVSIGGSAYSLLIGPTSPSQLPPLDAAKSQYVFANLFKGSTNLKYVYRNFFPFETTTYHCYESAFQGCSNLVEAPVLYSTTGYVGKDGTTKVNLLSEACYKNMFNGCTKLHTAPVLPARALQNECYASMFQGCTSLASISLGYIGNFQNKFFKDWVHGVESAGKIFYNGLDTKKSNSELPLYFDVVSTDTSAYAKELTFEAGDMAIFENNKLKTKAYNDQTLSEVIDGTLPTMKSAQTTETSAIWYYPDHEQNPLDVTTLVSDLTGNKIIGNYTQPSEFIEGAFNVVVIEETQFYCKWETYYEGFKPMIWHESEAGTTWQDLTNGATVTLAPGRYLLKGTMKNMAASPQMNINFTKGVVHIGGSVMALIEADETTGKAPETVEMPSYAYAFRGLFKYKDNTVAAKSAKTTISPNFLPAKVLKGAYCYYEMFERFYNLSSAPDLPAETLSDYCYDHMFAASGILKAPELPAKNLTKYCYNQMFSGFPSWSTYDSDRYSKLVTGPSALPATKIPEYAYCKMFYGATQLLEAPKMADEGVTQIDWGEESFMWMFCQCHSLVKPAVMTNLKPIEPGKHLYCFYNMYNGDTANMKLIVTKSPNPVKGVTPIPFFRYTLPSTWDGKTGSPNAPGDIFTSFFNKCVLNQPTGYTFLKKWTNPRTGAIYYPEENLHPYEDTTYYYIPQEID